MARTGMRAKTALLCLILLFAYEAQAQTFPGDRLPIEEVSSADIYRACEVPIASSQFDDGVDAPKDLAGMGVSGTWAYEQTNLGILRSPSLLSKTGRIDMWISNDTASGNMGLIHDVAAIFYLTGQAARNDALESTVMVRSRGQYVPTRGLLCLLGCQEALLPTIFSTNRGNFTGGVAGGVGDGDLIDDPEAPDEEENVEAGVAHPMPISQQMETQCRTRIVLHLRNKDGAAGQASVKGLLESLRQPGEASFFSPIVIKADTGEISSQVMWFQLEMVIESLVCALQAACIGVQLAHARKDHEGYYVSLTMISVQIFVYGFYWVRSLYYPLRYLNSEILLYFLSDVANIPRFVEFIIFVLYIALAIMVDTKRRKVIRQKSATVRSEGGDAAGVEVAGLLSSGAASPRGSSGTGPGTSERQLAIFFWPVYIVIGVCMWYNYDFDTFLRESTFLFLLPQVLANFIWDPSEASLKAVHIGYAVGITLLQMLWLAYEVMRPRLMGYDAFFEFPHTWYWSSMFLMIVQLGLFIGQRLSGARFNRSTTGMSLTGNLVSPGRSTEMSVHKAPGNTLTGMVQP